MSNPAEQLKSQALAQITVLEQAYTQLEQKLRQRSVATSEASKFNSQCLSAIERLAGRAHPYYEQAHATIAVLHVGIPDAMPYLHGILLALKDDITAGFLVRLQEIEHANLFADFFDMGDYLLGSGYKDAAAVLIGGVLESHLRQLAIKNGVPLSDTNAAGNDVPRKAERLNSELAKTVYDKLQQKNVTAWLDLRNKAAHAHYDEYSNNEVSLFSQGVRIFMTAYPA